MWFVESRRVSKNRQKIKSEKKTKLFPLGEKKFKIANSIQSTNRQTQFLACKKVNGYRGKSIFKRKSYFKSPTSRLAKTVALIKETFDLRIEPFQVPSLFFGIFSAGGWIFQRYAGNRSTNLLECFHWFFSALFQSFTESVVLVVQYSVQHY